MPLTLAPELLTAIVNALDASGRDNNAATALTLCRFATCSRLFHAIATDPKLWRRLYLERWRRHKDRAHHLSLLLDDAGREAVPWMSVYASRHIKDSQAMRTFHNIVKEPISPYAQSRFIMEEEMNCYDVLYTYQSDLLLSTPIHEGLVEKLWARDMLDSLRKAETLQIWLAMVTSAGEIDFVTAIGAFSGFRGCDRVELEDKLALLTQDVRRRIGEDTLARRPDQREIAKHICQALAEKGLTPAGSVDFHRLRNHFMNLVLDDRISTLPMTLVCIFCAIAQRLGLRASMIAFPARIICRLAGWVDAEDTPQEPVIIDIFEGGRVLEMHEIFARLEAVGIARQHAPNFLQPARATELVTRIGRNIIQSLQHEDGEVVNQLDTSRSAHAAVAALLFLQPNNLVDALPNLLHQFPMDVWSISKDYVPAVSRDGREGLLMAERLQRVQGSILEKDAADIVPRLREQERNIEAGDDKEIMYKIGTIFRHKRWGYVGVIRRWDPRCSADEGWMRMNNIDALDNGGRLQPFYSISADDGSDRYIAQINVMPMQSVALNTIHRIVQTHEDLGSLFSRADPLRCIFVMQQASRKRYPEDADWQDGILNRPPPTLIAGII